MFKPNESAFGKLQDVLSKYVGLQGSEYIPKPGATPSANPMFLLFFNRVFRISTALFPNNSKDPRLAFTVKVNPSEDVEALTLSIGAQTLQYKRGAPPTEQQFVWSGTSQPVELRVTWAGGTIPFVQPFSDPWAVFDFFYSFEQWTFTGSAATIEFVEKGLGNKPQRLANNGHLATVSLTLDTGSAPNIFNPRYFSNLTCVAQAVR